MFRKQPYWGWLLIALLLWVAAWLSDRAQCDGQQLKCVVSTIQQDLNEKNKRFQAFTGDTNNVNDLFGKQESALKKLDAEPFYLFAYQHDKFVFWSTNKMAAPDHHSGNAVGSFDSLNKKQYVKRIVQLDHGRTLVAVFPVTYNYYLENEYLTPSLAAFPDLENEISLSSSPSKGALSVADPSGKQVWFYVNLAFDNSSFLAPNARTIVLSIMALLATLLWVQILIIQITKARSWKLGLAITVAFIIIARGIFFFVPLPFRFAELQVFSADVYAYSKLIPSLGDLLLNELCILWIIIFLLLETPYKAYFVRVKQEAARWLCGILIIGIMALWNTIKWIILSSLVIDSQVSFDVYHTYNIDSNSVAVLFVICIGILIANAIARFLNTQITKLIPLRPVKYLLIAAAAISVSYFKGITGYAAIINVTWLLGFSMVMDIKWSKPYASPFAAQMILLSLFTCVHVAAMLHYDLMKRDLYRDRISFARRALTQEDPLMEYNFKKLVAKLQKDSQLHGYMLAPTKAKQVDFNNRFNRLYSDVLLNKYHARLSIFTANRTALFNEDTSSSIRFSAIFDEAAPTDDTNLHYIEDEGGRHYLSRIQMIKDGQEIGQVFVNISPKKTINESVYPELLQPATVSSNSKEANYAYAIYKGGHMFAQTSDYVFPLTFDTTKRYFEPLAVNTAGDIWEVRYQEKAGTIMVIAGNAGSVLRSGILLSYLFGLHLLLFMMLLGYRALLRFIINFRVKGIHLSLNRRIQISMQLVVFVSLCVVGIVTVVFFTNRYEASNFERNKEDTYTFVRFLKNLVAPQEGMKDGAALVNALKSPEFEYALSNFASNEKRDVNIFDVDGRLITSTQEDIYTLGLLARVINPVALQQMKNGMPTLLLNEQIGAFYYQSCYTTLKNDDGVIVGYISIPFFSSIRERNDQISNIIVALVNIYAVLFLLSSLLALIITSRITRTFNLLKGKFETLSLQQNELIEWPYDDEIGALVKEYNTMVRKVEESAGLLVQSERESAWREMAKQVAHEIKNPLTPMKLNIQYLQNALRNNHPDVNGLAARVSHSIIEQIDNLSYIASEFSNFAKMPEVHQEIIDLNDLLESIVLLHRNEDQVQVQFLQKKPEAIVRSDKSQMLRIFTNILQNAVQAVPTDEREGLVDVAVTTDNEFATVAITDNGIGISEDTRDKIFKPYFTTKTSGTGLGLAMTRKIIELWKGDIWFDSVEHEGTTFFVKLPLATEEVEP